MTNITIVSKREKGDDTYNMHSYIHTYLHPKISNEAGFEHRQPRLVTYPAQAKHNKA